MEEEPQPQEQYIVCCETPGCANSGAFIEVQAALDGPIVSCGVCCIRITNLSVVSAAKTEGSAG